MKDFAKLKTVWDLDNIPVIYIFAGVMYESLLELDPIRINFSNSGNVVLNTVLAFIMFGVALNIRIGQFKKLLQSPKPVFLGLSLQFIVLPSVTFALVILLNKLITPTVAMGMILVAACPGGNISNFMTSLSKGNTELSVTLTTFSTVLAVLMTPFNFGFWGGLYVDFFNHTAGDMLQPLEIEYSLMFETVIIIIGIPVLLGVAFSKYFPGMSVKLKKVLQQVSILFFAVLVVILFTNNWGLFVKHIKYIFIIVLIHNSACLLSGYYIARLFKQPGDNCRTMTIETGIQNSGLGLVLLLNPNIFPPETATGGMFFITAWWGIWHIVSGLGLSLYWSRKRL
ncbi:MAG: bile acid:sodium symporter family protein [Tannerella sp.]|jgi:BASS family bile acid:Na+ symporter|nr:bile acid:sodium symporter family protein [Tannerella sp.]